MDCESSFGTWSNSRNCYMAVADPQPPADEPVWEGRTEGTVYRCMIYEPGITSWFETYVWVGPAEPVVDPADLAQDAVAQMEIRPGEMGMSPPATPDRMSIVGLQTWLWVADQDEHTVGPITRSVTAGAVTVTATGHLDKIVWDMGDGDPTTCDGPGTAYDASYGGQDSRPADTPTPAPPRANPARRTPRPRPCTGWSTGPAAEETGRIELTVSSSTQVRVGEIQNLVTLDRR